MFGSFVSSSSDGAASLLLGDGSAAQVAVAQSQLVITEKSNVIETVNLAAELGRCGVNNVASEISSGGGEKGI
jgi:hypothetical protein